MLAILLLAQADVPETNTWQIYKECVLQQAAVYSVLDEDAETIAKAALASCPRERTDYRTASLSAFPATSEARTKMVNLLDRFDAHLQNEVIKSVLDIRLKKRK